MSLKEFLRYGIIAGIFVIPVIIPFLVPSSLFFPYITGKNFTFRIVVEIVLALWVILMLLDAQYRSRFSWILVAIVSWLGIIGLANLFGVNSFKSFWSNFERMEGYITLLHLAAYFLVASTVLAKEKIWSAFWYASLGASVFVALNGLGPIFEAVGSGSGLPRIDGTFGNPIYLAIYSAFHVFIAVILLRKWRGGWWLWGLLGATIVLHVATLTFTLTRGTMIGFVGGAILATLLIALFERQHKLMRRLSIGALALLVLAVGSVFALKDTEIAKENSVISRFTTIEISGGTAAARFMNWGMAWEGVKDRPLLGYGQGNYDFVFSKYYNPEMFNEEPWFDRTHNIVFDWLVAGGFLGALAYFSIPLALLAHLWILRRKELDMSITEKAMWTGLLGAYFVHNLFVFDNIVSYLLYFSVLAYLGWRLTEGQEPLWAKVELSPSTVKTMVVPPVLIFAAAIIYFVNIPGIQTSTALIHALVPQGGGPSQNLAYFKEALAYDQLGRMEVREQLVQQASNVARADGVDQALKSEYLTLARTEIEKEVARTPDSARLAMFAGGLFRATGDLAKGEQYLLRAKELAPTKQHILFQVGELKLAQGDTKAAIEEFKTAYELAPRFDEPLKLYALALIRDGQQKEAVDLLTERFETPAVDDNRLFQEWIRAERYDIAAEVLEKRLEKNPDDGQTVTSLAAAYVALGQQERAIQLLTDFGETHPDLKPQMNQFIEQIRSGEVSVQN